MRQLKELANNYVDLYDEVRELEGILKVRKEMLEQIKAELWEAMGDSNIKTFDEGRVLITRSYRSFPKVTDYNALQHYIIDVLGDNIVEYTRLQFEPSKLKELVEQAQKVAVNTGKPLEEVLPSGLEVSISEIISVRQKKENNNE